MLYAAVMYTDTSLLCMSLLESLDGSHSVYNQIDIMECIEISTKQNNSVVFGFSFNIFEK